MPQFVIPAVIGGGASLLAAGKASKAAKANAAAAAETARLNDKLIRDTQARNEGLATGQKTENTGLITGNQGVNDGLLAQAQNDSALAIHSGAGNAVGYLQDASQQAQGALAGQKAANTAGFEPYTEAGVKATSAISALLGLGGDVAAQQAAFKNWRDSTGYQFQLEQGSEAVGQNKATAGLLRSGAAGKALTKYGQGLADSTFGTYLGQLGSQQQVGLQATGSLAGLNSNLTGQSASAYLGTGNALAGNANQAGTNLASLYQTTANNRTANNTNSTNALVNSNTGITNTLIGGNTNAANALMTNNNQLQQSVAGYNTQAANTSANALTSFANNAVSTAGYLYGAQNPSSYGANGLKGLY